MTIATGTNDACTAWLAIPSWLPWHQHTTMHQYWINAYAICWLSWIKHDLLMQSCWWLMYQFQEFCKDECCIDAWLPLWYFTAIALDLFNEEMQDDIDLSLAAAVVDVTTIKPVEISRWVVAAINCVTLMVMAMAMAEAMPVSNIKAQWCRLDLLWHSSDKWWQHWTQPTDNTSIF